MESENIFEFVKSDLKSSETVHQRVIKEKSFDETDVEPITDSELQEVFNDESFKLLLFQCNKEVRETDDSETGFDVIRSLSDNEHHFSTIKRGHKSVRISLDYPTFPEDQKGLIKTAPYNMPNDSRNISTWSAVEMMGLHFHPIPTNQPDSDGTQRWFQASDSDLTSVNGCSATNSLKIRIKGGMTAEMLAGIEEPEGESPIEQKARELLPYYGFALRMKDSKQPEQPVDSIEAKFRAYQIIGMSLSSEKAQLLVLRDDPTIPRTGSIRDLPEVFAKPPYDIEFDIEAQRQIINYYKKLGFEAKIVFAKKTEDDMMEIYEHA